VGRGHPNARALADATDALQPDHFPACPNCGNLCGKLARICVDCGWRLYEEGVDPPGRIVKPSTERGQ